MAGDSARFVPEGPEPYGQLTGFDAVPIPIGPEQFYLDWEWTGSRW
jgi:hypothetical protein